MSPEVFNIIGAASGVFAVVVSLNQTLAAIGWLLVGVNLGMIYRLFT